MHPELQEHIYLVGIKDCKSKLREMKYRKVQAVMIMYLTMVIHKTVFGDSDILASASQLTHTMC